MSGQDDIVLILCSIYIIQPARISDIYAVKDILYKNKKWSIDGVVLGPYEDCYFDRLMSMFVEDEIVSIHNGRYYLSKTGRALVDTFGVSEVLDARRMYLLKQSRQDNASLRSDARAGQV